MGETEPWLAHLPYTLPYWERVLTALGRWPKRLARRFNGLIDYYEWSCEGTLVIFAQTIVPPAGELALGLLDFDFDDIARGMLRPDMGGFGCMIFGRGRSKGSSLIPELGEEIGKRIPLSGFIRANRIWQKTRFLWFLDGIVQRVFYYWLLIDLVSEFFYNWALGILRHPSCWDGGWMAVGGTYGDAGANGVKSCILRGPFSEERGELPEGVQVYGDTLITDKPVAVLWSAHYTPVFPLNCEFWYRLEVMDRDWNILDATEWLSSSTEASRAPVLVFRPPRAGEYKFRARVIYSDCTTIFYHLGVCAIKTVNKYGKGYELPIWRMTW